VAMIPVTATASPGHKCHSFTTFTHDFLAIVRALSLFLERYRMRSVRAASNARLKTTMRMRV